MWDGGSFGCLSLNFSFHFLATKLSYQQESQSLKFPVILGLFKGQLRGFSSFIPQAELIGRNKTDWTCKLEMLKAQECYKALIMLCPLAMDKLVWQLDFLTNHLCPHLPQIRSEKGQREQYRTANIIWVHHEIPMRVECFPLKIICGNKSGCLLSQFKEKIRRLLLSPAPGEVKTF